MGDGVAHRAEPRRCRPVVPRGRTRPPDEAGYPAHGVAPSVNGRRDDGTRSLGRFATEDELVAAHRTAAGREVGHLEPAVAAELEDFLGLRDLERVAAEPVEPVVEYRHAT